MKYRASPAIAVAAMLLLPANAALSQNADAVCFEVIPARPNIEPPAPIMIDKCSGRSWVLTRNGKSYRWSIIALETEKAKTADRVQNEGAAASGGGSTKCFTFNNRKFCE
jgi:hypothetical protein